MHHDLDLFGHPPVDAGQPAGLQSWADAISPTAEREIITRIEATELSPFRFHGWTGKRLTRSFGWTYDFDTGQFDRGEPIPDWLMTVRNEIAGASHVVADELVQALLIKYDRGVGIGWHKDRPVFGDVLGLSLGNPATLRFRRRRATGFDRYSQEAAPRSLYRLSGEIRDEWEHSIADMTVPRWSITFRTLRHPA